MNKGKIIKLTKIKKIIMTKEQQLEKERELLEMLEEQSLKMLIQLNNNGQHPEIDFQRAKEIIETIYFGELEYLNRNSDDYYDTYLEQN
jgi:hypothetical protein